jgi:hypothetical protein
MTTSETWWSDAFDRDESIIYLLDSDLNIVRCNSAWDRFALANDGTDAIASKVLGTCIMDFVPPALRRFYEIAYGNVKRFRREWWHLFECSSPQVTRCYHMRILPNDGDGILIINTLIRATPADAEPHGNVLDYSAMDGVVTMCSHCRRVRNLHTGDWDWMPELLLRGNVLATYGLCDFCAAYHGRQVQ